MQRPTPFQWPSDQQLLDVNSNDNGAMPSSSSTSSGSPPFSMMSTSPLDVTIGSQFGHLVGEHRRQKSASRTSNSAENIYAMGQPPTTPRSRTFDNRHVHGHPYALAHSAPSSNTHGFSNKRRFPSSLDPMSEDRLEDLWALHGLGPAHLGAGITEQLAASNLTTNDWNHSPANNPSIAEVMDTSAYFDAAMNSDPHFTVDRALQQPYDVHNPYNLFGLTEPHPADPEMDIIEDHIEIQEESPPSEEQETTARRSTSADSNATAGPHDSTLHTDTDEHEDHDGDGEACSDHENQDGDKTQSKPTVNNFVNKLHLMISDPKAADFIWWTELGTSFVVSSAGEFSRSILGQHFKHNNFSSFVRQLNMYGFHKINRTPRNQRVQPDAQQWEFSHPKFLRGRQDLLDDIKRKPVEPDPSNARQRVELPSEVAAKLRQMTLDHEEVVNALQVERMKVAQLATIVKMLYERQALLSPLPQFPPDLLAPRQPSRNNAKQTAMDLSGDSLVPSRTNSGGRGRQPPTQAAATRSSRRTRTDPEHEARQPTQKSNSTSVEGLPSSTRQGIAWNSSAAQSALGANTSRKPSDSSQLLSQLQIKNEANGFVR